MLGLQFKTKASWVDIAKDDLQQLLTDHAFAEQKAAANAVSLIINYSEKTALVSAMSDIAIEEMEHFKMVHQFMIKRNMILGRESKNEYAKHLRNFFPQTSIRTEALIQRLLIAALIEARSCERFKVFSENINDEELAKFYRDLMISEANHYRIFLNFARQYQERKIVDKKWKSLLEHEAKFMKDRGVHATVHG